VLTICSFAYIQFVDLMTTVSPMMVQAEMGEYTGFYLSISTGIGSGWPRSRLRKYVIRSCFEI
jgi:hypothetical protein